MTERHGRWRNTGWFVGADDVSIDGTSSGTTAINPFRGTDRKLVGEEMTSGLPFRTPFWTCGEYIRPGRTRS
jgi:hypothetical protein